MEKLRLILEAMQGRRVQKGVGECSEIIEALVLLQQAEEELQHARDNSIENAGKYAVEELLHRQLKAMVQSWADEVETASNATELCDLAERMRRCS